MNAQPLVVLLLAVAASCTPLASNTTTPRCAVSSDCPSGQSCESGLCQDRCKGFCGANTQCVITADQPSCSCLPGYHGHPFTGCEVNEHHECMSDSDCPLDKACVAYHCRDVCHGACGLNADCKADQHQPVCACMRGFYLNVSSGCQPIALPQCKTNHHCAKDKACIQEKCSDPCVGLCGNNTLCKVINHYPSCACEAGYSGDPFTNCEPLCLDLQPHFKSSKDMKEKMRAKGIKRYFISNEKLSVHMASKYCEEHNMELATIENEEEQDLLLSSIQQVSDERYWTSGRLLRPWVFYWTTTGKELTYTSWMSGEPNGQTYGCIALTKRGWRNYGGDNAFSFVCQYFDF